MIDELRAQRADADPGAGRELEVLRQAAVEQQPLAGIVGVDEFERVADLVEALLVEGLGGQRRPPPIAGRDVGSLQPCFELAFVGNELQFHAAHRQPDIAGSIGFLGTGQRRRRSLG